MNEPAEAEPCPPASPPETAERIYFPELDGLRFIAFMMVYLFHGGVPQGIMARLIGSRAAMALRENGGFGVQLFFILSGYLIATLLLREEARYGRIALRAFWIRRILRIWPLYYLIVVHRLWPDPRARRAIEDARLPRHAAHSSHSLSGIPGQLVDGPGHPPARLAQHSLERLRRRAVLLDRAALDRARRASIPAAAGRRLDRRGHRRALGLRQPLWVAAHDRFQHVRPVRHASLSGVLLALCLGWDRDRPRLTRWLRWLQWPLYAVIGWLMSQPHLGHGTPWHRTWDFVWVWLCGLGVVMVAVWGQGWLRTALSYSRLVWLGKISYGLYMYHEIAMWTRERMESKLPWFPNKDELLTIATLALTIALAAASYYGYERRFLELKRAWTRVPSRPV